MNRTLVYVAVAIILGLAMIIVPTWFFLIKANQYEMLSYSRSGDLTPPWLEYKKQNYVETVSYREVGILSISLVVALVAYVLLRREGLRYDYVWPPPRPC